MRVRRASLSAVAFTVIACGGGSGPTTGPGGTAALLVTIATNPVAAGSTTQASATLRDASGHVSTPSSVTWSSSNGAVALIDGSGLITARRSGATQIQATSAGLMGVQTVEVVAGAPASVTIYSGDAQAGNRGTNLNFPLCVLVTDASGNPVQGTVVTYVVVTGGGTIGDPTAPASGANGVAISGLWRLGTEVGQQTVTASVAGVGSVTFKATAN